MERNIALTVAALALLAIGIAIVAPGGREADPEPKLPWNVTAHADGSATVFTLTLGTSTIQEARVLLDEQGEITMFATPDGNKTIEVFFERIVLSGLRADMVMTVDAGQDVLQGFYDRGIRSARIGSGETKITLAPADENAVAELPIRHITYLPIADLPADLLESRFGTPAQRIPADQGVVHWLYPQTGLDIAVDPERKEVFQYVAPRDFDELVEKPLQAAADKIVKSRKESD